MTERLLDPRRRPIVISLMSLIAIASYNNLSAAAALPDIGDDLGDISLLPFVITIELLTSAVAVLAAGPVVDGLGARWTFRVASVGFVVTSLTVAMAPTMPALLGARAVQGIFAGAIMTVAVASIGLSFPASLRPRAFALTSAVWGVMGVAGPAIAAIFVATVGWRGIFLVNIPVTAVAAAIGWNRLPDRQPGATRQAFDGIGLALIAVVTTGALAVASDQGTVTLAAIGVVAVSGPLYWLWSSRVAEPVVRVAHILDPRYRRVHVTSMVVLAGGVGANSFLPLYLSTVKGQSSARAAFGVLFLTVGWSVSAWISSRLQEHHPGELVTLLGAVIITPAIVVTALIIYVDAPVVFVYASFYWVGSGVGMVTSTGAALLQSRTIAEEMGRLNAAHQFLRTISLTFGIAIVGAITLAVVEARTGDVEAVRDILEGDGLSASTEVIDAIGDGYALAILTMAIVVAASVPSAIRLVRTRHDAVASGQ